MCIYMYMPWINNFLFKRSKHVLALDTVPVNTGNLIFGYIGTETKNLLRVFWLYFLDDYNDVDDDSWLDALT